MAWNDEGNGIAGARAGDCARGVGPADRFGHRRVRPRFAVRDLLQGTPDTPLKCRRRDVDRHRHLRWPAVELSENRVDPLEKRLVAGDRSVADVPSNGERKLTSQIRFERGRRIAERHSANTTRRACHEQRAEFSIADRITNLDPSAAVAVRARRHAKMRDRTGLGAARRAVPGRVLRVDHGRASPKRRLESGSTALEHVLLRRYTERPPEGTLEVARAEADRAGELLQRWWRIRPGVEQRACPLERCKRGRRRIGGPASTARPVPGAARVAWRREELDVLAARTS